MITNAHVLMDFVGKVAKRNEPAVLKIPVLMMVGASKRHPGVMSAYANQASLERHVQLHRTSAHKILVRMLERALNRWAGLDMNADVQSDSKE